MEDGLTGLSGPALSSVREFSRRERGPAVSQLPHMGGGTAVVLLQNVMYSLTVVSVTDRVVLCRNILRFTLSKLYLSTYHFKIHK